jgi:hypothetical protein
MWILYENEVLLMFFYISIKFKEQKQHAFFKW